MTAPNPTTPGIAELLKAYGRAVFTNRSVDDMNSTRDAILAHVADLEAQRDEARANCVANGRDLDIATGGLDSYKADAQRYRWLRSHRDSDGNIDEDFHVHVDGSQFMNKWALTDNELDQAIDAAIAQRGGNDV